MTFKEKVQSMTAKEIILAMVDGLRNPVTDKIDMSTFGDSIDGICFGCAATNTICKIGKYSKEDLLKSVTTEESWRSERYIISRLGLTGCKEDYYPINNYFIHDFESAINVLRSGYVDTYNDYAIVNEFAEIKIPHFPLPFLTHEYTEDELQQYEKLANLQDQ